MDKVNKAEYIAVKETERTSKTGKITKRESKFIFRLRTSDGWKLARELNADEFKPFADVFSKEQAAIRLPSLLALVGLEVPEGAKEAKREAEKKIAEREAKREARERETLENGRNKFMRKNADNGAKRWDKLCEKYGVDGE